MPRITFRHKDNSCWTEADYHDWQVDLGARLRKKIERNFGPRREHKFAEHIGISPGSLSGILNGLSTPSATTLLKIQKNTEMRIADILGGYRNGKS